MYSITFWKNYKKRANSTKQPQGGTTHVYDADLLDSSGILSPVFKVRIKNPTEYNYAYIDEWKRYYHVNNWRYDRGIWTSELQIDVLASWKTEIAKQNLYVLRAASDYNGRIVDNAYPTMAQRGYSNGSQVEGSVNPFATAYENGSFVVGIVNTDSGAIGAVSYYVFTPAQFKVLVQRLMGDVSVYGVQDVSDELTKVLANPFQYVASCYWFPFADVPTGASVTTLSVGWWTFNIPCKKLSGYSQWGGSGPTISVPKHPESNSRGFYLRTEPYSEYYLWFPPWGAMSLPADKLIDSRYIDFSYRVDCITGMGEMRIMSEESRGTAINVVNAQIGVPIELAQMAPQLGNLMNQMTTAVQQTPISDFAATAAKVLSVSFGAPSSLISSLGDMGFTNTASTLEQFASNITTMLTSKWCPAQTIGTNGGIMAGYVDPKLYAFFTYQTDMDNAEKGRPLCERRTLSTLSGFIQCGETDIQIPCTKPEEDAIKSYLGSGFFLE